MRKYYSVFFILCSLFFYSNAQAQLSLGSIIEASQEAERKRISEAPKLAPTLIPQARNQSRLGSFLVAQLTIQSQDPETNKRTARKIRSDIKKIERDLNRLNAGISEWENGIYSDIPAFSLFKSLSIFFMSDLIFLAVLLFVSGSCD
jgi:hypothetical protein